MEAGVLYLPRAWRVLLLFAVIFVALSWLAGTISSPRVAVAGACSNEGVRQSPSSNLNPTTGKPYDLGLPECRAYEKVSPDYKQSGNVASTPEALMAGDGSAVAWLSTAKFGNGEGSFGANDFYISRRDSAGWSTANVTVPARLIPALNLGILPTTPNYSSDLSGVLWCNLMGESSAISNYDPVHPLGCAERDPDAVWALSQPLSPINNFANLIGESNSVHFDGLNLLNLAGTSADLSHVFFLTPLRLLAADTATGATSSLYELIDPVGAHPILRLVDVDSDGSLIAASVVPEIGGGGGKYQAVSADGSTAFFTTTPPGGVATIYARRDGTTTTAVSDPVPSECTTCDPTAKIGTYVGASSDGQRAFFLTKQQLVDADTDTGNTAACGTSANASAGCDLYLYDFDAPAGHHLVQASGGGPGDLTPGANASVQGVVRTSEDGSHAYFLATGVLTTEPNGRGQVATAGASNLYVYERDVAFPAGRTRFVATIPSGEINALLASVSRVQTTPDGRYLVFQTASQLINSGSEADTDGAKDVYRYDAVTGELNRISIGEPTYLASSDGNTAGMNATIETGPSKTRSWAMSLRREGTAISADGSYVVFSTPEALQADDINNPDGLTTSTCEAPAGVNPTVGCDVYLWHECSSQCDDGQRGEVHLISEGQPIAGLQNNSFQGGRISDSGSDVFFATRNQLVPSDKDENVDLYDARVDGGFPYSAPAPVCEGNESCHGAPAAPPAGTVASSATFSGSGNVVAGSPSKRHVKKKRPKHNRKKGKAGRARAGKRQATIHTRGRA